MLTTTNVNNPPDLFNPPDDAVSYYIKIFKLYHMCQTLLQMRHMLIFHMPHMLQHMMHL